MAQFDLNATVAGSTPPMTNREYYESQARQGEPDAIQKLAALPKLPRHGAHLWAWFSDENTGLHATRSSNGMGPSRLSRSEIRQWQEDEGQALERWERRALMAIDAAWVRAASTERSTSKGGDK